MSDYYTLLGVDRFASKEALRRAYRSHILAIHPDHNPDDDLAGTRAREIIEAYHVLSNPWTRRDYDVRIGYGPAYLVTQVSNREPFSFQWIPKLMLILVFFGILAGLTYGTVLAVGSRSMVFRPQLDVISVSPDPASPAILGRQIAGPDDNVAREDNTDLASNIISRVCLQTALYAEAEAHSGIRFFAEAAPASF